MQKWIPDAARAAELIVGTVFLAGALFKALDINVFAVQIWAYGVVPTKALLPWAAIPTLGIEVLLGYAAVAGIRLRGWTYAAFVALLLFFTALICYGWAFHELEDCGCFGPLQMNPPISVAKNAVLLLLIAIAWYGYAKKERHATPPRDTGMLQTGIAAVLLGSVLLVLQFLAGRDTVPKAIQFAVGLLGDHDMAQQTVLFCLLGWGGFALNSLWRGNGASSIARTALGIVLVMNALVYAYGHLDPIVEIKDKEKPSLCGRHDFTRFEFDTPQGHFNLATGEYLVAILSADCEHCQEETPRLVDLSFYAGLPPVIGLAYEEVDGQLSDFRALTGAAFPIHEIGALTYFGLIDEESFRVYYTREGNVVECWDGRAPNLDELMESVTRGEEAEGE